MPLNGLLLVVLIITYLALVNLYSSVGRIIMFHHHMKTEVGNIHTAVTTTGACVHFLLYWLSLDATVYGLDMRPYVLYSYTTIFTYGLFPFSAITKWPAWIHTSRILHHWNRRESSRHLVKTRLTKPYFFGLPSLSHVFLYKKVLQEIWLWNCTVVVWCASFTVTILLMHAKEKVYGTWLMNYPEKSKCNIFLSDRMFNCRLSHWLENVVCDLCLKQNLHLTSYSVTFKNELYFTLRFFLESFPQL